MQRERVLDTSVLVRYWCEKGPPVDEGHARRLAEEIGQLHQSTAILSPIYLEFLCGVTSATEARLADAFLSQFRILDDWTVRRDDLLEAVRLARRVPRDGNRRQLGDCLIRAMSRRLRRQVVTYDTRFPKG